MNIYSGCIVQAWKELAFHNKHRKRKTQCNRTILSRVGLGARLQYSVRYFPKGIFPSDNFPSGNFPNVQFLRRQLPKGYVRPSEAPQAAIGGRAMRLRWAWLPSAAAKIGWGPITFGKLPLGKNPLEKFLTSSIYGQGLGWVKCVSMVKG